MSKKIAKAMRVLSKALKKDPDYSWGWLCNIAMPIYDTGTNLALANKAAARVMDHIFGTDMENHPLYKDTQNTGESKLVDNDPIQGFASELLRSSPNVFHIKVDGGLSKKELRKLEKKFAKRDPGAIYIATGLNVVVERLQD